MQYQIGIFLVFYLLVCSDARSDSKCLKERLDSLPAVCKAGDLNEYAVPGKSEIYGFSFDKPVYFVRSLSRSDLTFPGRSSHQQIATFTSIELLAKMMPATSVFFCSSPQALQMKAKWNTGQMSFFTCEDISSERISRLKNWKHKGVFVVPTPVEQNLQITTVAEAQAQFCSIARLKANFHCEKRDSKMKIERLMERVSNLEAELNTE